MRPTPLKALLKLINHTTTSNQVIHGVSIDSREIKAHDLFFAIKGAKSDGHAFLQEAAAKHAAAAIVDNSYQGPCFGLTLIAVSDVKIALQEMAAAFLKQQQVQVVAITGSIGKTTTKDFAKTLIGSSFRLYASPKSYNSQLTVPLCILSARGDEEILLLEMSMSAPNHLARLVEIAPPTLALITTVAVQHADAFVDGLQGIAQEKAAIFSSVGTKLGIYHHDMPFAQLANSSGSCLKKTFSTKDPEADFFMQRNHHELTIKEKGSSPSIFPLILPMKGYDHNFLAAWSVARQLGIDPQVLSAIAPFVKVPPMRFEKIEHEGITFINDAYNANPDAIVAALESLPKPQRGGKVIAILSDMDALGVYAEQGHKLVATSALNYADMLFCLGKRASYYQEIWRSSSKPFKVFSDREELQLHLEKIMQPGDVVLLKGARAYALEKILSHLGVKAR